MSYMDRDNIIEEGLFDKLKNKFKDWKKYDKITRVLMRDPKWKKNYIELQKNVDDLEKLIAKEKKKRDMK
jgi:hypothetical protein